MARGKEFPLFVALRAVDKATAPLQAFNRRVERMTSPLKNLNNRLRVLGEAAGISRVGKAFGVVRKSVGGVITEVGKLGAKIAGLGAIVGGVFGFIVKKTADYGNAAAKTAQRVGVSATAWQELAYVAEQSDVSIEGLETSLGRLNRNLTAAATGNKTAMTWFKRAGVEIRDSSGRVKTADQVLDEMADTFQKYPDGAKKTAVAIALLGRTGADMIPMLNVGSQGIADLKQEAHDLALVLGDGIPKASEEFSDNILRLWKSLQGLAYTIGSELIPIFDEVVVALKEWIVANRELVAGKLKEWIKALRDGLPELKDKFFEVLDSVKAFIGWIGEKMGTIGGFKGALVLLGLYLGGPLIASLAVAASAIASLGAALLATPVGWFLLAVAGIAGAAVYIKKKWGSLGNFFKAMWQRVKDGFREGFVYGVLNVLDMFNPVAPIARGINRLIAWLTGVDLFAEGDRILGSLLKGIGRLPIVEFFKEAMDKVLDFFSGFSLYDVGERIILSMWEGLKNIFAKMHRWFNENVLGMIPDWLKPKDWSSGGMTEAQTAAMSDPSVYSSFGGTGSDVQGILAANAVKKRGGEVTVKVDVANAPRGTTATVEKKGNVPLHTDMGYAMLWP